MDRGVLFAVYVACRHKGLRDLFSGSQLMLQSSVDRHHILPRAQFPERRRGDADTVANIAFIGGSTNRSVGSASPDVYLKKLSVEIRDSQCIPADEQVWQIDAAEEFWKARRELLAEAFNSYLRSVLPNRRIDLV